ncbi:alpha/beta hydrolase [Hamadaea sp. NPDC051192]|uniref:alpha/beta hydrolase n=1 Tax=Hamadaea sp. NPDC051192 TaxID=3154940 RepID=UPI003442D2D6
MTGGFVQLRDTRFVALGQAADAWQAYGRQAAALEDRSVQTLIGPLRRSGWAGPAASAALPQADTVDDQFEIRARTARLIDVVLDEASARFAQLQSALHDEVEAARTAGFRVGEDGVAQPIHDEEASAADAWTDRIAAVVKRAGQLDDQVAGVLAGLRPDGQGKTGADDWNRMSDAAEDVAVWLGVDPKRVPPPGSSPQRVADWWKGLSDQQRQLYLDAYPQLVGNLDGLPATDRDSANRLTLRSHLAELTTGDGDARDLERSQRLLDRLERNEYGDPNEQLFLLGIDNSGDGRAIVAVGNPDDAANTCVLVPGVGTTLDGMTGQIDRATTMQRGAYAQAVGTGESVSVIAWLGYDAPEADWSAISHKRAEAGAPLLDGFVDGLHVTHGNGPAHTSVLGHSYGSTVVGNAAHDGNGLAADDIITAGSPGMDVNTVADLQIDPQHVWAGAAKDDPIAGPLGSIWGIHDNEPTDPSFGANRFHVDTSGHSGYWAADSQSLANISRVVIGDYDHVTLDHGHAP